MFAAMFYVLRTGIPWRDLPERFGPWGSVYTRFRRWCAMGLFARLLAVVAKGAKGELRYSDCSHIKLHPAQKFAPLSSAFHRGYYRWRHKIENFFCRLKRHRRISTRFEKLAVTFLAFVQRAALRDWRTH